MGAICTSAVGIEASSPGWKTYYVCLTVDGRKHFKFGVCRGKVANRFLREPDSLQVTVLKVWEHPTESAAHFHEECLFREYVGDRPYIGRCGPLTKGGNTETYSHDVLSGESPPKRFIVRMLSEDDLTLYTYGYAERNPKEPYRHLHRVVKYMDYSFGPEGQSYFQVPGLSHPDAVTLCDSSYFYKYLDVHRKPSHLRDVFREAALKPIVITLWTDYSKMRFLQSYPFTPETHAVWV